jgi:pyridoxal phosphate enzyme (YggS family)
VSIEARLREVLQRLQDAASKVSRHSARVTLVAVSKTKSIEAMDEYAQAATRVSLPIVFGENYLQEIKEKQPRLPAGSELHMIGPLQSNKVRDAARLCDVIESVHSLKVLELIAKEVRRIPKRQRVLLQVNIGHDEKKSGFAPEDLAEALRACERLSNEICVEGLMTILPYDENPEASRPHFKAMAELRTRLIAEGWARLFHNEKILLSMGMSDDFAVAIEEGADIVRVGTALFGERGA